MVKILSFAHVGLQDRLKLKHIHTWPSISVIETAGIHILYSMCSTSNGCNTKNIRYGGAERQAASDRLAGKNDLSHKFISLLSFVPPFLSIRNISLKYTALI